MESLGDILRRITARNISTPINGDGTALLRDLSGPAEEPCAVCNGVGWVSKRVSVGHPDFGRTFPCDCQETKDPANRTEALRRYSNLGPLSRINFLNTRQDGPLPDAVSSQMFRDGLNAAVKFAERPAGWLTFTGPSGSGKTHLAVAVANRCIEHGETTFFIAVADLLDHLRAAYSPDNPVSYDELFDQVRNVPVLVLDDLGGNSATPWAEEKLFQVINHRFNQSLPTVITVRGSLHRLNEHMRTRIESLDGFSQVHQLGQYNTQLTRGIGNLPIEMEQRMTLATFDTVGMPGTNRYARESLENAKTTANNFANNFAKNLQKLPWIIFSGGHGSGKTHLAAGIAIECLRRDLSFFYTFAPDLLDHLRGTFNPGSLIGYDELFEQIKTVPLLILDDLGGEHSTPWAEEKLYQIIVHRHETRLPTVITTVLTQDELGEFRPRIRSRLKDLDVVDWVFIAAPDYRLHRRNR